MAKSASAKRRPTRKAARKATDTKTAGRKTAAKTARPAPKGRPPAATKAGRRPQASRGPAGPQRAPQRFAFNHLQDGSFVAGLRAYAQYRDLGVKDATDGLVQAHVIRFVPPCRPEQVSKLHYHDVEFQMIYVLNGWIRSEFAGLGAHTFRAGSCWIQPPRIEHKVLDYSDDCEVLEVILPADFETVELD